MGHDPIQTSLGWTPQYAVVPTIVIACEINIFYTGA